MTDKSKARGKATTTTPIARPTDDGRVCHAFLQAKAAHRTHLVAEEHGEVSVPARSARLNSTETGIDDLAELRDHRVESDEDDPFGHGALWDEPQIAPTGVCGLAALDGEFARVVANVVVGIGSEEPLRVAVSEATPSLAAMEDEDGVLLGAHVTHVPREPCMWCGAASVEDMRRFAWASGCKKRASALHWACTLPGFSGFGAADILFQVRSSPRTLAAVSN